MNVKGQSGPAVMSPALDSECPVEDRAVLNVTVYDLVGRQPVPNADVTFTEGGTPLAKAKANADGIAGFSITGVPSQGASVRLLANSEDERRKGQSKALQLTPGQIASAQVYLGQPSPVFAPVKPASAPKDLKKTHDFFVSYTGKPNLYDSFKKIDHKFRQDPEGPVDEVPILLACCAVAEKRNGGEMAQLKRAFCETVSRLEAKASSSAKKKLKLDLTPVERAFDLRLEPAWFKGKLKLSALGSTGKLTVSLKPGGEQVSLPCELLCDPVSPLRLYVSGDKDARATLKAEVVEVEGLEPVGPFVHTDELELSATVSDAEVRECWLAFKRNPPAQAAFEEAAGEHRDTLIKLARIGALFWYSDTGDVLMNASLRGTFGESLKKRVVYLKDYYKDDSAMVGKLPKADEIDRDLGIYTQQIGAQVAMLRDALESDLLEIPPATMKLYRGMALEEHLVGNKFEVGKTAQLAGFSSSAADFHVAYRFMRDSASDILTLNGSAKVVAIFYRIRAGAQHGRLLGAYSLHHGETEVLFKDGIFPTVKLRGRIGLVARSKFSKKIEFIGCTEEEKGDEGFQAAMAEFIQNKAQVELTRVKLKARYEEAVAKEGASKALLWPQGGETEVIELVSAEMAPG